MPARIGSRTVSIVAVVVALAARVLPGSLLAADPRDSRLDELKALVKGGKYAEAEGGARALLTAVEAAKGAESAEAANVLDVLVESLWRGGKTKDPDTRTMAERAVAIKEKALGPDHPDVAASLSNLAKLYKDQGQFAQAEPLYRRALAIREKALGAEHPDVGKSLNNLASLYDAQRQSAQAEPLYNRALAIFEKALGPDHLNVAAILNNLALLNANEGRYTEAEPFFKRALAIREKALGPDHPDVAASLNNLALLAVSEGQYAQAEPCYKRALAIREKALGPNHPDVAQSLNNLASLYVPQGRYAQAEPLLERALAIREKALGSDHPDVAASLQNLAELYVAEGQYARGGPFYKLALAMFEKAFGPNHPLVADILNNLASLYVDEGQYAQAEPLFQRSLSVREKALGADHPDVAQSLHNLASLYEAEAQYAQAEPLLERSLSIREKALGPDHPVVAANLHNLAELHVAQGEYAQAEPLYKRALAITEKTLGPDHPNLAATLNGLATLEAAAGHRDEAVDHALEAERIGRNHLRLTSRSLSERQALQYAAVHSSGLNLALTLAVRGLDAAARRKTLDALVRSRAVVMDEMAARQSSVGRTNDPEVARWAAALGAARTRLASLVVRGEGEQKPNIYRGLLDSAREEEEQAEKALAAASVRFAGELTRSRVGLDEVTTSLPPGSALVVFAEYSNIDLTPNRVSKTPREHAPASKDVSSYLAFVLRAGERNPQVVDLGSAPTMDALVAAWKKEASSGGLEAAYREAGSSLRRSVWDPLASSIGDAGRVFIVPDGSLNLVSLAALPLDDGAYLVERGPLVHYVSAERDLVPSGETRHGEGLLALGAPSYDARSMFASLRKPTAGTAVPASKGDASLFLASTTTYRGQHSACDDFAAARFGPLPATGKEVREIVKMWERQFPDEALAHAGVLDLRDSAASETALKVSAPGRRVLHLATHAFFLGGGCASALGSTRGIGGLAETPSVKVGETPPPVTGENPLLLSGLVLAGANRRSAASAEEDDGILTAEEIASLNLSGVEWAVLSACETGVGDVHAGEGVFGLRRAFQVAGAETLIMSLWSVDDMATRSWMKALYEGRLEEHLDTAEAVRRASLTVLKQRRKAGLSTHPFYWAAFVAAGNWR